MILFGGGELLGRPWALLPEVTRDGKGIYIHGHSFGWYDSELLAVRAVFVNRFYHLRHDNAGANASETFHFFSFRVHGINCSELAAGISKEDEEMIGSALLHVLYRKKPRQPHHDKNAFVYFMATSLSSGRFIFTFQFGFPRTYFGRNYLYFFNSIKSIVYLNNLVFLRFIDFSSQAAATDGIMNDELV